MTTAHIEHTPSELTKALAEFQKNLPAVTLDGDNPHFKSKFATLANITQKVLPLLSEQGIAFSATPRVTENGFVMEAHLLHTSGERLSASFPITDTNPQKVGSAVTYFRRYALAALTGIVADTDDDGNAASNPTPAERKVATAKQPSVPRPGATSNDAKAAQDRVREWIADDEAKKAAANEATTKFKAEGLAGVDLWNAVLEEVKK